MLRLDQLEVSGRMRFCAKPDFSSIVLSFASLPSFKLRAECTVSWGVVPLPIQEYLQASPRTFVCTTPRPRPTCQTLTESVRPQTAVREQMKAWLVEVPSTPPTPPSHPHCTYHSRRTQLPHCRIRYAEYGRAERTRDQPAVFPAEEGPDRRRCPKSDQSGLAGEDLLRAP